MKYYSESVRKMYDTIEELEAAEKEAEKAKDERKAAADVVEAAYKEMNDARVAYDKAVQNYNETLSDFCNKYGSYKKTLRAGDVIKLDPFWNFFNF